MSTYLIPIVSIIIVVLLLIPLIIVLRFMKNLHKSRNSYFNSNYLICWFGAGVFVLAGIMVSIDSVYFIINSKKDIATIVDITKRKDKDNNVHDYLIYQYKLPNGLIKKSESKIGFGENIYKIKDKIPIRYSLKSTDISRIDSFANNWGLALVMFGASIVAGILGLIIKRKSTNPLIS